MTTPARRQYLDIKAQHPDALLMYQVGDFFEFFDEDARIASRALQIVLTNRSYGPTEHVPLAGVPLHAMETYIGRLVAQGFKVAVCEQVEPPGRGLVRRAVTRVLTPGTVVEPGLVPSQRDNYLVAVTCGRGGLAGGAGLACVEASTGVLTCTQWAAGQLPDAITAEIERLRPAEVLVPESRTCAGAGEPLQAVAGLGNDGCNVTLCPPHYFDRESSRVRLCRHFGTPTLAAFGCEGLPLAAAAAGAIMAYLERMNPALLRLVTGLTTYHTSGFVEVDGRTWSALEAFEPARGAAGGPTLLTTLNATRTAMGARLLRRTLLQPLQDRAVLEARLDAVAALHGDAALRQRLGAVLDDLPDLERLTARVVQGTALPRELHGLAASLSQVPSVRAALTAAGSHAGALAAAHEHLDPCAAAVRLIESAVAAPDSAEGRTLRRGYSQDLDALVDSVAASRRWIADLEPRERERTGIKSLRVSYNKVFGYSIEVTRPNLARVPADYERRQTLATGERYVTPELKEHEARLMRAEERMAALERELYSALLERLAAFHARLRATANALAQVDVWLALAEVAAVRDYVRPELCDDLLLEIRAGRHPVVEAALDGHEFIPNDTTLGGVDGGGASTAGRVLLLTGPNMAGKSTYLRQVAQIVLLAHVGAFVPASYARIGLVDRIFTRVGADDDLARGISTFMREMTETAYILRHATARSLVVLDEVGRGTSTHDGLAIARAVVEYLHDRIGARTLFATHFHELADLANALPGIRPAAMQVFEQDGQVVFLHRLGPGRAGQSYGVHVARMAGVPATVTARAAELLDQTRAAVAPPDSVAGDPPHSARAPMARVVAQLREPAPSMASDGAAPREQIESARALVLGLASLSVAAMTPMEAINILFSLQQRAAAAVRTGTV
jgi:DNA mismatch repair protein MutS